MIVKIKRLNQLNSAEFCYLFFRWFCAEMHSSMFCNFFFILCKQHFYVCSNAWVAF